MVKIELSNEGAKAVIEALRESEAKHQDGCLVHGWARQLRERFEKALTRQAAQAPTGKYSCQCKR